nr:hypothetical protein JVGAKARI_JVGAKARI_CDS_0003 [Microvirus sp.]
MKDKLLAIFVAFVRATFSMERLQDLIADLFDILYDRRVGESDDVSDSVQ